MVDGVTGNQRLPQRNQGITGSIECEMEQLSSRVGGRARRAPAGEPGDPLHSLRRELAGGEGLDRRWFRARPVDSVAGGRRPPPRPPIPALPVRRTSLPRHALVTPPLRAFSLTTHPGRTLLRRSRGGGFVGALRRARGRLSDHLPYGSGLRAPALVVTFIAIVHGPENGPARMGAPIPPLYAQV